jgi:hypothetical protein
MFFLSNTSNFSTQPKKKIVGLKKLRKNTFNPDVANAAAVGGTLGLIGGAIGGGSSKLNKIGAGVGLAAGTGLGIANKYRKQKNY